MNQEAGPVKAGLHNCGIHVLRNIAIVMYQKCQYSNSARCNDNIGYDRNSNQSATLPSSEIFEKILQQFKNRIMISLASSIKLLVNECSPIVNNTQSDSSWKQLILGM